MKRLLLLLPLVLVACGGANVPATETRTAEIVELTVQARLLPTQNAAVPPTPVPTPVAPSLPSSTPVPPAASIASTGTPDPFGYSAPVGYDSPQLIAGSWVAYASNLHIRFFAPPSLVEDPGHSTAKRYALVSPSNVYDFEALDIYRFVGNRGGEFALTWEHEFDAYAQGTDLRAMERTSGPLQQQVGAYQGNKGQFNYVQTSNDLPISGTMWVGQVGNDEMIIVYRCSPEREALLDRELAQVFATIDFNAQ